jgi:ubiquinone biosynthesis monooxygenase Coq7
MFASSTVTRRLPRCFNRRFLASRAYTHPTPDDPATSTTPSNITQEQHAALDSALRVDQAGEVAANWIYRGQHFVLGEQPVIGPLIQVCRLF